MIGMGMGAGAVPQQADPGLKIVIASGGFDPIHQGHVRYFRAARELGNKLIVGINSDEWLVRKKGKAFMPWFDRAYIVQHIVFVNHVAKFDDSDGSAKHLIQLVRQMYPKNLLIFANGGDVTEENCREKDVDDPRIIFEYGVGGSDKVSSSSDLLKKWCE